MVVVSTTFSAPAEGIILQTPSTKLVVNNKELGTATLYITENNVVWGGGVAADGGSSPVITLMYMNIVVHGLQREPSPALYLDVNYDLNSAELSGGGDVNEEDNDENFEPIDDPSTQLRFIPQNEGDLQAMFSAMCEGQALHPGQSDDEEAYMDVEAVEEGDDDFEDAEEINGTPAEAAAILREMRLENSNGVNYEDCEDADLEED